MRVFDGTVLYEQWLILPHVCHQHVWPLTVKCTAGICLLHVPNLNMIFHWFRHYAEISC